jgi:hypothetical protein
LKPAVRDSRGMKVAQRFFGVPQFHYHALADGIGFLLSRLRPDRVRPTALKTPQFWLFPLTKKTGESPIELNVDAAMEFKQSAAGL